MKQSAQKRPRSFLYPIFIASAFAAGIGLAFGMQQWHNAADTASSSASGVSAYGGDFVLESASGPAGLRDYRGKLVMIYFGFAACPDVCPTSLGIMKKAYNTLTADEQQQVSGLFISIDPERDTPEIARNYARHFQENFDGLSGKPETIANVARSYGSLYRKMETPDSALTYTMDHSSVIYLVDQQGVLREKLQHGVTPQALTAKLQHYL